MASFRFNFAIFSIFLSVIFPFSTAAPHIINIFKRSVSLVGEPSVLGNGTYPRATHLKDGSLLGCYTSFSGGKSTSKSVRSTDNGKNWTTWGDIITVNSTTNNLGNCFLHQLPNSNRVLAALRNHDRIPNTTNRLKFHRMSVYYSDDNGKTWEFLSNVATTNTTGLGLWEPFMMDGLDDSLMLFFSRETRTDGKDQNSILVRSYDGGKNWGKEQTISGGDIQKRDGMLGVARMGPNSKNLIAVFESLSPDTGITSITSSDDGKTWGNRRVVYKSNVEGARNQAPQVVYVGSTLVASFQTNEDNLPGNADTPDVKVVTSTDGGATWNQKTTVHKSCNWAGEIVINERSLLVLCDSKPTSNAESQNLAQRITIS